MPEQDSVRQININEFFTPFEGGYLPIPEGTFKKSLDEWFGNIKYAASFQFHGINGAVIIVEEDNDLEQYPNRFVEPLGKVTLTKTLIHGRWVADIAPLGVNIVIRPMSIDEHADLHQHVAEVNFGQESYFQLLDESIEIDSLERGENILYASDFMDHKGVPCEVVLPAGSDRLSEIKIRIIDQQATPFTIY